LTAACIASWSWMGWLALSDVPTARIYFGTDTRCAELLAGGVLALALGRRKDRLSGWRHTLALSLGLLGLWASASLWAIATVNATWLYLGGLVAYTAATLGIVVSAVQPSGPVRTLLSVAPLTWLGRISYGAYLYHWPLFLWLDADLTGWSELPLAAARFVLTLGLADLSYRFLEEPIRRGRSVVGAQRWVLPPVAIAAVVAAFLLGSAGDGSDRLTRSLPVHIEGATRIAVVGDSLAFGVASGLQGWATRTERAVVLNAALAGCGIARGGWPAEFGRSRVHCDTWHLRLRPRLLRFDPDVIVILTAGWDLVNRELPEWGEPRSIGDPEFDRWLLSEYESALSFFLGVSDRVVWLTIPCLRARRVGEPTRAQLLNDDILRPLAEAHPEQLTVVDLAGAVCPEGQFTNQLYGIDPFRPDGIHFSAPGRAWVGDWLGAQVVVD